MDSENPEESLVIGIPTGLIGQQNLFGAVITRVTDKVREDLGMLKLTDLPPLHVKTSISEVEPGVFTLVLSGCADRCEEGSKQPAIMAFPIIGFDEKTHAAVLDLAPIGKELNLIAMMDPNGNETRLKTSYSKTSMFDYSVSTLVFDVESHMVPKSVVGNAAPDVSEVVISTRWYLKLASGFSPAFMPRDPTAEVGFFTTHRGTRKRITRFATTGYDTAPVHYFIKNVPAQWQSSFAKGLDNWNEKLRPLLRKTFISYEFVSDEDESGKNIIPGDVRYNVIEWDLNNRAPYGGLGPSIANQYTGEIFSANVLVQGPTIMSLYTHWFEASQKAKEARQSGDEKTASEIELRAKRKIESQLKSLSPMKFKARLGNQLEFRVVSQMPSLQDPLFENVSFDEPPEGMSFEEYMDGYFQSLVAHEVGHNLGLRHNFSGNLGAAEGVQLGKVSRSIMEYLGPSFRYFSRIAEYDVMAMSYGYLGKKPAHKNWFCTDEHVADLGYPRNSAECSRDDATNDPYSYFEKRVIRAVDLIIGRGSQAAPAWEIPDVSRELSGALNGLALYAYSAPGSFSKWTNFVKAGRPASAADVPSYILSGLKAQLCSPELDTVIAEKESVEAQERTKENLSMLRDYVMQTLYPYQIDGTDTLDCGVAPSAPVEDVPPAPPVVITP